MRISRRTFLVSSITGLAAIPGYSRFLEPGWFEVTEKRVPLKGAPLRREVRVLHLSDLHASDAVPYELIERAIELGLEQRPDFACLTGDFITRAIPSADEYTRVLRRLAHAVPTFACFGNHDGGRWAVRLGGYPDIAPVRGVLERAGIVCLHNAAQVVDISGQRLLVAGLGDLWSREVRPEAAFPSSAAELPCLVLAHNPDTRLQLGGYRWDLMLSGHTHGGQVVIPIVGYAPFQAVKDRRFLEGLQPWEGRLVHVTRGVGNLLGVRLNCRPEVSLLVLAGAPGGRAGSPVE